MCGLAHCDSRGLGMFDGGYQDVCREDGAFPNTHSHTCLPSEHDKAIASFTTILDMRQEAFLGKQPFPKERFNHILETDSR